jgi:hypothetical protein
LVYMGKEIETESSDQKKTTDIQNWF